MERLCDFVTVELKKPEENDAIHECEASLEGEELNNIFANADYLFDIAKRYVSTFPFFKVKVCWLRLLVDASIAKAVNILDSHLNGDGSADTQNADSPILNEVVRTLDYALVVAGGIGREELIQDILSTIETNMNLERDLEVTKSKGLHSAVTNDELPSEPASLPNIRFPVRIMQKPSLSIFEKYTKEIREPAILKGAIDQWPALEKWRRVEFWLQTTLGGRRVIPVELGRNYLDDEWRQELMTFEDFLLKHIITADETQDVAYLAQHDLLSQMPALKRDITTPDYCYCDVPPPEPGTPVAVAKAAGVASVKTSHPSAILTSARKEISDGMHPDTKTSDVGKVPKAIQEISGKDFEKDASAHRETPEGISIPPTKIAKKRLDEAEDKQRSSKRVKRTETSSTCTLNIIESTSESESVPEVHQNIWFGGRTVSPLHHDPYHNILCQVHGTKYVRLYSPHQSAKLYPRSKQTPAPHLAKDNAQDVKIKPGSTDNSIDWSNNSWVDVEAMEYSPSEDWDEVYPGISQVPYFECILRPGDALYIPVGWWHYVRACSVGISISFWWL